MVNGLVLIALLGILLKKKKDFYEYCKNAKTNFIQFYTILLNDFKCILIKCLLSMDWRGVSVIEGEL